MVSPAVVGTGSTNKVSGTAQTKASAKKSGDFKSVMADSLANGAKILKMLLKKNSMYQMKTSKWLWSYLGLQHWIFFQLPK